MKSVRDMVLSMAVIGLGAWLLYTTLPNDESQDPTREISYEAEFSTAGRAAPYALLAPDGLSDGWRATSVSYRAQSDHGAVWHLGFLDPSDEYAAVEQGDGDPRKYIAQVTHRAARTEVTETINGREWVRYEGAKYNALVLKDPLEKPAAAGGAEAASADSTTLVTGTASHEQLRKLAAALRPYDPDATRG